MIITSIDLMDGQAVQLIGGRERAIDAGDPMPIAQRFARTGEIAVIDLDAALGQGNNCTLVEQLCARHRCRVGGGIRSREAAIRWLDAGAHKVIIGTAAEPELLASLPRERVIAALDCVDGEVVVEGWQTRTGRDVLERMRALRGSVGGFLVTFVEREGRMVGTDLERVRALVEAAGGVPLTVAGGVTSSEEIATLDELGVDAQLGMALYSGRLDLAEAFCAPLRSDRGDGLWSTVVVDEHGRALGSCWSNAESVREAIERGRGVYWSRSRGLWVKGETSGAIQELVRVDADCDRDALRFTVRQRGSGFCHQRTASCWGELSGLPELACRLAERRERTPPGSFTGKLLAEPTLLRAKLLEEAGELAEARGQSEVAWEAADLIYFTLVAMARAGVSLADVESVLAERALQVTRRDEQEKGNAA
jgi:phosphoribosyl-ATP pyrophosphohydrolase/phosphoribosyl-AMP cyclohydrolase